MLRHCLILTALVAATTLPAGGCRSCSDCHDYDPPVANCDCCAGGVHRAGSVSACDCGTGGGCGTACGSGASACGCGGDHGGYYEPEAEPVETHATKPGSKYTPSRR